MYMYYLDTIVSSQHRQWAIVVVIRSQLDLQLPDQSVPITTKVVSLNPAHCEMYSKRHYEIKFVSDL